MRGNAGYISLPSGESIGYGEESTEQKGYEDVKADAINGFARTEQDISIMTLPLEVLELDIRFYN